MERPFCVSVLLVLLALQHCGAHGGSGFVRTADTLFIVDGRPFYFNGFNAYWLMYMASIPAERGKVSAVFQQASSYGMTVVRTWAFSDAGFRPLQVSPGCYNEDMFKQGTMMYAFNGLSIKTQLSHISHTNPECYHTTIPSLIPCSFAATICAKMERPFCVSVLLVLLALQHCGAHGGSGFVRTADTHFIVDGRPFYFNGFNAYWLMYMASIPAERGKVSAVFQQASSYGMTVVRTWAFSDAGFRPLQVSPGCYNEDMFKGLDFVISEAKNHGVYLILSLVNGYENFGGRKQYVQWAKDQGQYLSSEDDFFTNEAIKGFYKNHVKVVLTRVNTITGVAYKDEPTILAWEMINEPRCPSDLSGRTLQNWITEMAGHVKSIDSNHLLAAGLEGFYGESMPERKVFNPGYQVGTDFITNHMVAGIDFATIHVYPDQWMPGLDDEGQIAFIQSWFQSHVQDANTVLKKPLLVTEFGKSSKSSAGDNAGQRDTFYSTVFNAIYESARAGGPCVGGLFWHLLTDGMDDFRDGYEIVLSKSPSTSGIISQQSCRISSLNNPSNFIAGLNKKRP